MLKKTINSIYFYFLLPAYGALFLLCLFFNIPNELYPGLAAYFAIITVPVLLYGLCSRRDLRITDSYDCLRLTSTDRFVILTFCVFILLCGPLDIYVNGFKLMNPATYTEFHGIGRYIRHLTVLVWIFIPVAMLYLKHPYIKAFFIGYALLFPILIIDRNRLFIALYTLFFCMVLKNNTARKESLFVKNKWLFYVIPLAGIVIFALIGYFRSGTQISVPSSGIALIKEHLPLKQAFSHLPIIFQQVVLYITTPIFNFATIVVAHFTNPDFLLSQLSPFNRENFDLHPYAPIFVERFNVGTEFYPFLLYQGLSMVIAAYLLMLLSFFLVNHIFKKWPNIFTLLVLIKVSFVILFMGFGPQFFILLNLMFFVLMMFLWLSASMLAVFAKERRILFRGAN